MDIFDKIKEKSIDKLKEATLNKINDSVVNMNAKKEEEEDPVVHRGKMEKGVDKKPKPKPKPQSLSEYIRIKDGSSNSIKAVTNTMFGINYDKYGIALPEQKHSEGLIFMTRPGLRLDDANLMGDRVLARLLDCKPNSVENWVRAMLDPRLIAKFGFQANGVNNQLGFIPTVTNSTVTLSGWLDQSLEVNSSTSGVMKEQYTIPDDTIKTFGPGELTLNIKNFNHEPMSLLMSTWLRVISGQFSGDVSPYNCDIARNLRNFDTRIYRILLDEEFKYVTGMTAIGVGYPVYDPSGSRYDYTGNKVYNDANKELNFKVKYMANFHNDPILITEFNEVSAIASANMAKLVDGNINHGMVKIPDSLKGIMRHRGLPYINPNTSELEWYVHEAYATQIKNELERKK